MSVGIGCVRDYRCENKEKSIRWFFCVREILTWVVGTGFSLIVEVFSWKCWPWPFSAWLEVFFLLFLWHFCHFVFFHDLFLLKFQTQLLLINLSFSGHCFDAFFEPLQSNQTKHSILMRQQGNEHKNCAKQKFYIYKLNCLYFC